MRADADGAETLLHALLRFEADAPFGDLDRVLADAPGRGDVLAAGEDRGLHAARIGKERLRGLDGEQPPLVHHGDLAAHVVGLVAVVRDHQHLAPEALQQVAHLHLQRVAQVSVERREGLVEQQDLRVADEDARERDALLLPAGELGGFSFFQPFELHHAQDLAQPPLLCRAVLFPVEAAEDVLSHRHVGEERVVLEQIAHAPRLRRQIDLFLRIEEHPSVERDAPLVGLFNARDALQGHALAAARSAEQGGDPPLGREAHVQREAAEPLADVDAQTHAFTAFFCRASSMFTLSSTTVLIARLISTQNIAPFSSFVRQS